MNDFVILKDADLELTRDAVWLVREHLRTNINDSETQEKYASTLNTIARMSELLRRLGDVEA